MYSFSGNCKKPCSGINTSKKYSPILKLMFIDVCIVIYNYQEYITKHREYLGNCNVQIKSQLEDQSQLFQRTE